MVPNRSGLKLSPRKRLGGVASFPLIMSMWRFRASCSRYDENLDCAYDPTRLNVAIHVRMGDRREFQDGTLNYFRLLDVFMHTVSQTVVGKGLAPPLFHIFSETLLPCPSEQSGFFDEFPAWPVQLDQVRGKLFQI